MKYDSIREVIKMPRTYTISKEEANEIKKIRKTIIDKRVDKRLHAKEPTSKESKRRGDKLLKKINTTVKEEECKNKGKMVRLMFQDEAGFGRINKPKYCWCKKGIRPLVPCHHIREYRYVFGAVEPLTGESCFIVMPYCNTVCMNVFLKHLSEKYSNDIIVLVCDGAAWHKSKTLEVPANIRIVSIPPYTPEMNPIEQIWKEIRKQGFKNEAFKTLENVVKRLCDVICSISSDTIKSITGRDWIISIF